MWICQELHTNTKLLQSFESQSKAIGPRRQRKSTEAMLPDSTFVLNFSFQSEHSPTRVNLSLKPRNIKNYGLRPSKSPILQHSLLSRTFFWSLCWFVFAHRVSQKHARAKSQPPRVSQQRNSCPVQLTGQYGKGQGPRRPHSVTSYVYYVLYRMTLHRFCCRLHFCSPCSDNSLHWMRRREL